MVSRKIVETTVQSTKQDLNLSIGLEILATSGN